MFLVRSPEVCVCVMWMSSRPLKIVSMNAEMRYLLDRSIELGRVLFTQDDDLLAEATKRQREGLPFGGVVYGHQLHVPIGVCVRDLEIIAKAGEPGEFKNRVEYLPL